MTATILPWLELALCGTLIGVAGSMLARYGDIIAQLTGLTRTWIGLVLLATATSLPELFTGVSAVTVAAAPDIAVGDALGSCLFNLVLLVVLDASSRGEPMYRVQSCRSDVLTNCAYQGNSLYITDSESGCVLRAEVPVSGRVLYSHA